MNDPIKITPETPPQWAVEAAKEITARTCSIGFLDYKGTTENPGDRATYDNEEREAAAIIARHAPQAPAAEMNKYTQVVLTLAMFDLAFHRLRNAATRLLLTRRKLTSGYQDAVLASYLDELDRIASENPPTWPTFENRDAAMSVEREGK